MREIDEIIVHCTATPEGRPVTVAEINAWHLARGFSGIGYHRVVGLHGERWEGRPIERVGAHVKGKNRKSIGLVYAGGLDSSGNPKDTRNNAQKDALEAELIELRDRFDIKKVSGHREYANKACPSFDASAEYDALFPEGANIITDDDGILERGEVGPEVAAWAEALNEYREQINHPFPVPKTEVFDHTLELVTLWFQRERGILADGKVGPQTEDEMERALTGFSPYQVMRSDDADLDLVRKHLKAAEAALGSA